jgi:hypothetical protein
VLTAISAGLWQIWIETILAFVVTSGLIWSALEDAHSRHIPRVAGICILAVGLISLVLSSLWLASTFYIAAIWASGGGLRRLPMILFAIPLVADGVGSVPFILGILFVLAIFELGWLGGGDAQLAFVLIGLARDWWMLGYFFGGTILLALILVLMQRGVRGAARRFWWVARNLEAPDAEAIRVPWALIAALGGLTYIWIHPGMNWQ